METLPATPMPDTSTGAPESGLDIPREIIDSYNWRIGDAYNKMFAELVRLFYDKNLDLDYELSDKGKMSLPLTKEQLEDEDNCKLKNEFHQLTGRCGGRCGASTKAAQAGIITWYLLYQKEHYGHDITPAVAHSIAKAILPRGINKNQLLRDFGEPGRTAANKSSMALKKGQKNIPPSEWPEPIPSLAKEIEVFVVQFGKYSNEYRFFIAKQWKKVWEEYKQAKFADFEKERGNIEITPE